MCDFSRVSAWFCDEKISLKKSCFYLYIRRRYEPGRNQTRAGIISEVERYRKARRQYRGTAMAGGISGQMVRLILIKTQ